MTQTKSFTEISSGISPGDLTSSHRYDTKYLLELKSGGKPDLVGTSLFFTDYSGPERAKQILLVEWLFLL